MAPMPASEQVRSLLLEYLKTHDNGQYSDAVNGVIRLAVEKGLIQRPQEDGRSYLDRLEHQDQKVIKERVRQAFWQLLVQGILVFGLNEGSPNWPWYRLTDHGQKVAEGQGAQPYDPDNCLQEFKRENPDADPVIVDYLDEALRAFNHGCQKSAAVMIGAASEKALLLLLEAFEAAIADEGKREKFRKSYNWTIASRYRALKNNLDRLVEAKVVPREQGEVVSGLLPVAFELIRRHRNAAGHPEIVATPKPDTNFLTLRGFTEYVRGIYLLIGHFKQNPVHL